MKARMAERQDDETPAGVGYPLTDLLGVISEALDVREDFPRISQTVARALAHDSLEMIVHDHDEQVSVRAQYPRECPRDHHLAMGNHDAVCILADLRDEDLQASAGGAGVWVQEMRAAGYRSCLSVRRPTGSQTLRLGFFSKQPAAYTVQDVPTARHIVACLGVAVSHAQFVEGERERFEERVRAARVGNRASSPATAEADRSTGRHPVGESAAWQAVLTKATKVAATQTTVFLQGESGTGKEVLARFIHRSSPRRGGPFVAINCAALPEQLLESELFGYERGAFTGAQQPKPGQIELASSGVLFLDEVGEMSPAGQAKLLRVLQERECRRLGGTRLMKVDVRVIAASNRPLRQAVAQGSFREDLYYRLHVFDIQLPPLRERIGDIPLLAAAFLRDLGRATGSPAARLTPEATEKLVAHRWPGNVRELQNALEQAVVLSASGPIRPEHLSLQTEVIRADPTTDLGVAERRTVQQVLQETDGNKTKAARRLGITRTQLYVRLRRYALDDTPIHLGA